MGEGVAAGGDGDRGPPAPARVLGGGVGGRAGLGPGEGRLGPVVVPAPGSHGAPAAAGRHADDRGGGDGDPGALLHLSSFVLDGAALAPVASECAPCVLNAR